MLAERALLGGLGHGVLELSAQLQEESALLNSAEPAAPPPEAAAAAERASRCDASLSSHCHQLRAENTPRA